MDQLIDQDDFAFPGMPYPVQIEFMRSAYRAMSSGGLAVLESPTGTGKSLSLICSAMTWLKNNRLSMVEKRLQAYLGADGEDNQDAPKWLVAQHAQSNTDQAISLIAEWSERKTILRDRVSRMGIVESNGSTVNFRKRKKADSIPSTVDGIARDEFLTEDVHSTYTGSVDERNTEHVRPRVIICSRTHSQLSQLVGEIRKTQFGDSFNFVTLGSRKQCCINPTVDVERWSNDMITDVCQKLVDSDSCEFYHNLENLTNAISSQVLDMEDMCTKGRALVTRGCPYHASRRSVSDADVILLPYSSITTDVTRKALSIDLRENILIIDEGHNFLEAINSSLRVGVKCGDLRSLTESIKTYASTYATRLSPSKLVRIKQLQFLTIRLEKWSSSSSSHINAIPEFLEASGLSQLDLNGISLFLQETDFMQKLRGFISSKEPVAKPSVIYSVLSLLTRVQGSSEWDRVIIRSNKNAPEEVVFVTIDSDRAFAEILKLSRAVLVIGGTMKPIREFEAAAKISNSQFHSFFGVHNIPEDRLFARVVGRSLGGSPLSFTYDSRANSDMLKTVHFVVMQVFDAHPPGGVILFVPSYEYAGLVAGLFCHSQTTASLSVLCDNGSTKPEEVLRIYKHRVQSQQAVLLISVVNGSLSEGIDFKDDLCRCVVLVGLPYPSNSDPILSERINYFDVQHKFDPSHISGREYYEAKCMKAVNQSIGRAIRHSNDWSAVLLLDHRFERPSVTRDLSEWFRANLRPIGTHSLKTEIESFFRCANKLTNI